MPILTWQDIEESVDSVPSESRALLRRILDGIHADTQQGRTAELQETHWYLNRVEIQGHAGIGETPVYLDFPPCPGLIVVTAPNGTGKTSITHGMRLVLSNGNVSNTGLADRNLHCDHRRIEVKIAASNRQATLSRSGDEPVRWIEGSNEDGGVPQWWEAAFQRHQPVLLYPEVAQIIHDPGSLHDFLKSALDLDVLETLRSFVQNIRDRCTRARKTVEDAYRRVDELLAEERHSGLRQLMLPTDEPANATSRETIRAILRSLTQGEALPLTGPPRINELSVELETLTQRIDRYTQARRGVVAGADKIRRAFSLLADVENRALADKRTEDTCPVCGAAGRAWFSRAQHQLSELDELLVEYDDAKASLDEAIGALAVVPMLPETDLDAARSHPDLTWYATTVAEAWGITREAITRLRTDTVTEQQAREAYAHIQDLRRRRDELSEKIKDQHASSRNQYQELRSAIEGWLSIYEQNETVLADRNPAEKLDRWVSEQIKLTRAALFDPIAQEATRIWKTLNPNDDVEVAQLTIGGGTKQAQKVFTKLRVDNTQVPDSLHGVQVLSTGQRNALSLAVYLPRAAQDVSPFRFLVLDDPVQAFDEWRVRYLAERLVRLADRFQIVVFTHDVRLWHEIYATGPRHVRRIHLDRPSGRRSLVRAQAATSPGHLLLAELKEILKQYDELDGPAVTEEAVTAFTLAVCRQALDAEITQQVEILGRRSSKSAEDIAADLDGAYKTKEKLKLLAGYCTAASLSAIDTAPYEGTVNALNQGAHGQAPPGVTSQQRWTWHDETKSLVWLVAGVVTRLPAQTSP